MSTTGRGLARRAIETFVVVALTGAIAWALGLAAVAGGFMDDTLPCHEEDGSGQTVCVWRGDRQGNGIGARVVHYGPVHWADTRAAR